MSTYYEEVAAEALAQIQERGQARTLYRYGKTFNPVTGTTDSSTYISGAIDFLQLPVSKGDAKNLDKVLVEALTQGRLVKLLVAASSAPFEPDLSDVMVLDDGFYWHFRKLKALKPDGATAILYTVLAERGNLAPVDQAAIDLEGLESAVAAYVVLIEQTLGELLAP